MCGGTGWEVVGVGTGADAAPVRGACLEGLGRAACDGVGAAGRRGTLGGEPGRRAAAPAVLQRARPWAAGRRRECSGVELRASRRRFLAGAQGLCAGWPCLHTWQLPLLPPAGARQLLPTQRSTRATPSRGSRASATHSLSRGCLSQF